MAIKFSILFLQPTGLDRQ